VWSGVIVDRYRIWRSCVMRKSKRQNKLHWGELRKIEKICFNGNPNKTPKRIQNIRNETPSKYFSALFLKLELGMVISAFARGILN
jgi:hypothetical protein